MELSGEAIGGTGTGFADAKLSEIASTSFALLTPLTMTPEWMRDSWPMGSLKPREVSKRDQSFALLIHWAGLETAGEDRLAGYG